MPYLDILLSVLQWLILLFFIVIGIVVGVRRGFKKSYYYLITNFLLTLGVLIIVSLVSIRLFFPTAGDLLAFVTKYLSLNDNIINYIKNPNISPIFFAIVDVVFKILLFIIIFPVVKILLNILLFNPIYRLFFKNKKVLKSYGLVGNLNPHNNPINKFAGGLIGAFRGIFASLLIFIPIILISGTFTPKEQLPNNNNPTEVLSPKELLLATNNNSEVDLFDEAGNILKIVQGINTYGPGRFVKMIKTTNGTIDEEIFDAIFGGNIITTKDGKTVKEKLRISKELNTYGSIFAVLLENDYLNSDFDFKNINYDNDYLNIDYILNELGNSQLVNLVVPIAIDVLEDEGIFMDKLGFSIKDINESDLTYKNLQSIKWADEFATLSKVAESLLKTGSVGELESYLRDPNQLLEMDQKLKDHLVGALNHLSELDILIAGNVLVEYALRQDKFTDLIKWDNDPKVYARESLSFVFEDRNFFKKELKVFNNFIKEVIEKDLTDLDFKEIIVDGKINIDHILTEGAREVVITGFENIINLATFKNLLPVGIDAGVYYSPVDLGEQSRLKIEEIIDNIDYEDEISNVDNIYKNIIKLGLNDLIKNNKELIVEIDAILQKPEAFNSLKEIVNTILIESEFVGELVEYGSGRVINKVIKDGPIKDFLLEVDKMPDFSYGLELVNALNLAEDIYKVSDLNTVISQINSKKYLELAADLSDLNDTNTYNFRENLLNFQMLDMLDYNRINELKTLNDYLYDYLVVPVNIDKNSIKADLNMFIDLGFEVARQSKLNGFDTLYIRNVNLENTFDKERLTEIFTFDLATHENSIFVHSLVTQLRTKSLKLGFLGTIKVAPEYGQYDSNSVEWINEINNLVVGSLDLIEGIIESDNFTLTINNLLELQKIENINPDLIYDLERNNSLNKLGQSYNIRYNITNIMTNDSLNDTLSTMLSYLLEKDIQKVDLSLEKDWLDSDGFFSNNQLKALLKSLVVLDIRDFSNLEDEIADKIFGMAKNNKLEQFYESDYVRVMASRFLISKTIRQVLADSAGFAFEDLTFNITDKDQNNNLTKEEVVNIFKAFDTLGIDNPGDINISNKTLKALSEDELEQVLISNYFYQLIDLTLKEQLEVPNGALVDDGSKYDGMIKKSEIKALIEALKILDIEDDINLEGIRLSQVNSLLGLDSRIIDQLISDQVKEIIDVPEASKDQEDNITNRELNNLIKVIEIVSDEEDPLLDSIDMTESNLTTTTFDELLDIDNSPIINRLISESIIQTMSKDDETILESLLINDDKDVKREEIIALNKALKDLGLAEINSNIDLDLITISNLITVTDNDSMSLIIRRLISNATRTVIGDVDTEMVLEGNSKYILRVELNKLFEAISEIDDKLTISEFKEKEMNHISFDLIINANTKDSNILRRLISNALIASDVIIVPEETLAPNDKDIKKDELTKFLMSTEIFSGVSTIKELSDYLTDINKTELSDLLNIVSEPNYYSLILIATIGNLLFN